MSSILPNLIVFNDYRLLQPIKLSCYFCGIKRWAYLILQKDFLMKILVSIILSCNDYPWESNAKSVSIWSLKFYLFLNLLQFYPIVYWSPFKKRYDLPHSHQSSKRFIGSFKQSNYSINSIILTKPNVGFFYTRICNEGK